MKKTTWLGILLLAIALAAVGWKHKHRIIKKLGLETPPAAVAQAATPVLPTRKFDRLRGVHYFADAYPKQFWNSFEPADVAADFKKIRADGFNSIVLIIPWAEFQPSLEPGAKLDERMFERLNALMDAAQSAGLGVVLRLSYYWTYRPDAEVGMRARLNGLFHDARYRSAWLDHLGEMHKRVARHPAFRLAFLTWEDLYPMELASAEAVLDDAGILGEYRKFLARTTKLDEVSKLYGKSFSSFDEIPFPARKTPAYAKVFDYWDDALINALFVPARERFPDISFEVRADWDPVWEDEKKITWKNHAATYALPGVSTVTSYYSTAWGMKNIGDKVTAAEALKAFDFFVAHVREKDPRQHLFLDQLLFYTNLPDDSSQRTQILPQERDKFLDGVAGRLRDGDISYALWYYRDYVDNVLYNAHFAMGLDGWRPAGKVEMRALQGGRQAALLTPGASLTQHVPANLRASWNVFKQGHHVCVTRGDAAAPAAGLEIGSGTEKTILKWDGKERRACGKLHIAADFDFTLKALADAVDVDLVELYAIVEPSAVYSRDGHDGSQLTALRKLNALSAMPAPTPPAPVAAVK